MSKKKYFERVRDTFKTIVSSYKIQYKDDCQMSLAAFYLQKLKKNPDLKGIDPERYQIKTFGFANDKKAIMKALSKVVDECGELNMMYDKATKTIVFSEVCDVAVLMYSLLELELRLPVINKHDLENYVFGDFKPPVSTPFHDACIKPHEWFDNIELNVRSDIRCSLEDYADVLSQHLNAVYKNISHQKSETPVSDDILMESVSTHVKAKPGKAMILANVPTRSVFEYNYELFFKYSKSTAYSLARPGETFAYYITKNNLNPDREPLESFIVDTVSISLDTKKDTCDKCCCQCDDENHSCDGGYCTTDYETDEPDDED